MILDEIINRQLAEINQKGKLRILKTLPASVINFGSNDYLGLSKNKKVFKAAQTALKECGLGATSSRLVAGNHRYYQVLEKLLAENKGYEKCLVFGSGYLANIGLMQAIAGKGDLILADKLAHNCLINGAKLSVAVSGAELKRFPHNNYQQLEEILAKYRSDFNNCFIISESIFSMDGDRADIAKINLLAKKYRAVSIIDDAHSCFTPLKDKPDIITGTLSKALGSYGGYICANKNVIDLLINRAGSLIFSTALPASVIAGATEALNIINQNSNVSFKPFEMASYFCELIGIPQPQSQIVPLIIGDNKKTLTMAEKLLEMGYFVPAIRPPTVPENTARLRFSFSSQHKKKDVEGLARAVIAMGKLDNL